MRARRPLFGEDELPVLVTQGEQVAVVAEIEELPARALRFLAGEVRQDVVAVEVDLVGHVAHVVALEQLLLHVGVAGGGKQRRQPVQPADDLVRDRVGLDVARPANESGHAEGALPVGVLLAAKRRGRAIRPGVGMRAVVGRVDDDGVIRDAQVVERLEQRSHRGIVLDHAVGILGEGRDALGAAVLGPHVGAEVHPGAVVPDEEGLAGLDLALDEVDRRGRGLVVDRLHPLAGQRAGVLDGLLADLAEARIHGRVVLVRGLAAEHAARPEHLAELRVLRVIEELRLLLGVEVVQVAEELIEAVNGGQILVAVAEVVLAELAGGVAERLEHFGDGRVLLVQAHGRGRHADLAQAGAKHVLAGDERRPPGRAALLRVVVGEGDAFLGDAIDVGRAVAHQAFGESADVGLPMSSPKMTRMLGRFACPWADPAAKPRKTRSNNAVTT